jgi:hypothetical protein
MELLEVGATRPRLFTYKVAFDAGTAPNPYGRVCTLAICKPAIRNAANVGDIVVGLEPGDSRRIVYCMEVTDKMRWDDYIKLCTTPPAVGNRSEYARIGIKVPNKETDQGDCIWYGSTIDTKVRSGHSGHDLDSFDRDIKGNKFVLLSTRFWYFGSGRDERGAPYEFFLHPDMRLPGRGHISNLNGAFIEPFIENFNGQLQKHPGIRSYGKYGQPDIPPESKNQSKCARGRADERVNDANDEETTF